MLLFWTSWAGKSNGNTHKKYCKVWNVFPRLKVLAKEKLWGWPTWGKQPSRAAYQKKIPCSDRSNSTTGFEIQSFLGIVLEMQVTRLLVSSSKHLVHEFLLGAASRYIQVEERMKWPQIIARTKPQDPGDPNATPGRNAKTFQSSYELLTASPLYCFKQCRRRHVFANQKDVISKSSLCFWGSKTKNAWESSSTGAAGKKWLGSSPPRSWNYRFKRDWVSKPQRELNIRHFDVVYNPFKTEEANAYLQHLLDAIDGGGEQGVHFLVVVDVIRVPDAHVEDVGRKAGNGSRHCLGLEI